MSERTIRYCDECSKDWTPANHWIVAWPHRDGSHPMFTTFAQAEQLDSANIRYDFCGQECAVKAFNRWMDTGSILKQEAQGKTEAEL